MPKTVQFGSITSFGTPVPDDKHRRIVLGMLRDLENNVRSDIEKANERIIGVLMLGLREDKLTLAEVDSLERRAAAILLEVGAAIENRVGETAPLVFRQGQLSVEEEVAAATKLAFLFLLDRMGRPEAVLSDPRAAAARLLRTGALGVPLSSRLKAFAPYYAAQIRQAAQRGVALELSLKKIVESIRDAVIGRPKPNEGRSRARSGSFIARVALKIRDEISWLHSEGVRDAAQLAPEILMLKYRLSPLHPRTDLCDTYEGQEFRPDSEQAKNLIPVHENCICFWQPVYRKAS